RLKPGATIQRAQASLSALARRLEQEYPKTDKGIGIRVVPELEARPVPLRMLSDAIPLARIFVLLLAAMVLILACMNVANVLLVRATVRVREIAIRAALGSGRWRLVRQMLTESLILAAMGAAAGIAAGKFAANAIAEFLNSGSDYPVRLDFTPDWRVF